MSCEEDYNEDDVQESSAPSSLKRVKTSMAWDYLEKFVDDKGLPKAKCKSCGKVYMSRDGSGTSNMRRHVKKCGVEGEVSSYPPLDQEKFREKISEFCQLLRMEKTNSAGTTGTEECMDGDAHKRLGHCPEVGSVNGRVRRAWKEIMEGLRTDELFICDEVLIECYHGMTVNGRAAAMLELLKHILEGLGDPDIYMIGVCGMDYDDDMDDLLVTIKRRVERDDLFGMIVMEHMKNKSDDLTRIQKEIARELGFSYQQQEKRTPSWDIFTRRHKKAVITENAKQLSDGIRAQPKILFILRDLNATLDLAKLGIPFGVDHKGCKLILTSQSEEILSKMNVQHIYRV